MARRTLAAVIALAVAVVYAPAARIESGSDTGSAVSSGLGEPAAVGQPGRSELRATRKLDLRGGHFAAPGLIALGAWLPQPALIAAVSFCADAALEGAPTTSSRTSRGPPPLLA